MFIHDEGAQQKIVVLNGKCVMVFDGNCGYFSGFQ